MISIQVYDKLKHKEIFFDFLKSINTTDPASENMWDDDWESKNYTLPYILENTNRFTNSNGEFHIVFDDDRIIACGGVYISNFSQNIALAGVRTWVDKKYRNKLVMRDILLPKQKQWCIAQKCKIVAISVNEYNRNLLMPFKRIRLGEDKNRMSDRQPYHLFYNGAIEVEFPVTIQYTKQWVLYEKLDPRFDFDWSIIA
jgi:hypothetical protein